jgi:hypothetical protein
MTAFTDEPRPGLAPGGQVPFFDVGVRIDPARLVPGARVRRYTSAVHRADQDSWDKPDRVHVESPCCPDSGRLFRDVSTHLDYPPMAFCWACGWVWRLYLHDDNDGGYTAEFELEEPGPMVVISRRPSQTRKATTR